MKKMLNNIYFLTALNKFFTCFFGIISTIFINRYMGPSLKGEYAVILNTINIIAIIGNLGIYQAYPNFKRKKIDNLLNIFVNIFYLQFLIIFLFSALLFFFFNSYNIFMFLIVPIMVFVNQLNFVCMVEYSKYRNIISIINSFVKCFYCFLIYLLAPHNLYFAFSIVFISEFFMMLSYLFKLKIKINFSLIKYNFLFKVLKFGIIPMLVLLFLNINYKIDVIMLGNFIDDISLVGIYSVGAGFAEYVWIVPDVFKEVLFSKTAVDDSIRDVKLSLKASNIFIILLSIFILFFGKVIIRLLYGIEFENSYYVTVMLIAGTLPMSWYKILNPLFLAQGRRKIMFFTLLFSAVCNIFLNIILIPVFGINGAAFASIVSYTLCGIPVLFSFCNRHNVNFLNLFVLNRNEFNAFYSKIKKISGGK